MGDELLGDKLFRRSELGERERGTMWDGMAVLFATLITLIMVPALYLVLEDFRDWTLRFLKYLGWRKEEERPRSLA